MIHALATASSSHHALLAHAPGSAVAVQPRAGKLDGAAPIAAVDIVDGRHQFAIRADGLVCGVHGQIHLAQMLWTQFQQNDPGLGIPESRSVDGL